MILKEIFVFAVSCNIFYQAYGQYCVPDAVQNITVGSNGTLWWDVNPNNTCEITNFLVDLIGDGGSERHLNVTDNFVDISFLKVCEKGNFTVTPVSNSVPGLEKNLIAYVPLPPDADLSLYYEFLFSETNVGLKWDLKSSDYSNCPLKYQLIVRDVDQGTVQDVSLENKSAPLNMSPCIPYAISLRAISEGFTMIEGPFLNMTIVLTQRAQVAPTLKSIDIQVTSISMIWKLEGDTNRCPLIAFYVEGGINSNSTVRLWNLENPSSVSVEIKYLRPNSMYYFQVFVENSGGRSPAMPIAVQTLRTTTLPTT